MLPLDKTSFSDESPACDSALIQVQGTHVFKEGETFDSYEELLQRMDMHSKESLVYYWRRDSRTVERAYTKTSRPIAAKLKYYLVRFACIYGGMKFQTRGVGRRVSQSMRSDCPSHILLRASKCGEKLVVISVCNDHNHEISEKASQMLPQNRKLPRALKEEVVELLRLKIDKKKIIDYVKQRENKKITSKDLFNLASRLKSGDYPKEVIEKRNLILQNICRCTTEKSIKSIITSELAAFEPDGSVYYTPNNHEIVEYISPEHEFGVNETIIDSIVEARKREINQWEEQYVENGQNNNAFLIKSEQVEENCVIESEIANIIIDEREILDEDNVVQQTPSPVQGYNDLISQDECYYFNCDDRVSTNSASISKLSNTEESDEKSSSNCSQVLFETTTDDIVEEAIGFKSTDCLLQKQVKLEIPSQAKRSLRRILKCRKCGTNARLTKMQIDYLRAQKEKLLVETSVLRLKKKKLKAEVKRLKQII